MSSLSDETSVGVGVIFHLVHDSVESGVYVVSLGHLSFLLGAWVLQVSGFSDGDSVSGLVTAVAEEKFFNFFRKSKTVFEE